MDIKRESEVDISLTSTEWKLTGDWQQIVRAKESIGKRFTSTTVGRGPGACSQFSEGSHTAQDSITTQGVGSTGARLSGMVKSEDVPSETGAESSPENSRTRSPETFGYSRKECSTSQNELIKAMTENNRQSDAVDVNKEAIPIDVNIWQYIERICGNQMDAIERDCCAELTADEHGDVLVVTISSNDDGRDSMARWRLIELHSDVMSRVVVLSFTPLPEIYGTVKLKEACKRVRYAFRHNVLVKTERGTYVFIGEVDVAKKARRRLMKWAQIPQASWITTNQRNHGNQRRPKQTTPRLESPNDKTTELTVPDLPQKHVDNSRNVNASQPHLPDREISMTPSKKRTIFEFQDQPSCGSEFDRVQTGVFKVDPAEPQAGALSKLDNCPTTLHNVDVMPASDTVDHPESRATKRMCEQVSTAMTGDRADNSTATSPDANTDSTHQAIGMVNAPGDIEAESQRMTCLLTEDVIVSERHTNTADSSECAEDLNTMLPASVSCCLRPTMYALSDAKPVPDTWEMNAKFTRDDQDLWAIVTLKQPVGGTISKLVDGKDLPGYQQVGNILIMYNFPSGILEVCIGLTFH